ncbi:fumarate hydratase [Chloroflexota bacterium]
MIDEKYITEMVAKTFEKAAVFPSQDGLSVLKEAYDKETQPQAKEALKTTLENLALAREGHKSMCQTYATPGVYIYLGSGFNLNGINMVEAVRQGCELATVRNFLRPSMVDPITRKAIGGNVGRYVPDIDVELIADSDVMEIIAYSTTTLPASRAWIWLPAEIGEGGINILKAITERALGGGGMLCPPIGVGVGIGGSLATAVKLTRKAFLRGWDARNPDPQIAEWEQKLLGYINHLGIGPFGLGGDTFALAVNIELADTHAAALPVAVEFYCWASALRRAKAQLFSNGKVEYA